jgi:hypothetical protein
MQFLAMCYCYLRIVCLAIRSRMEVDDVVFVLVALCRSNGQYKQHDEGMPYYSRLQDEDLSERKNDALKNLSLWRMAEYGRTALTMVEVSN